jgi:hypothetical protein
VPAAITDAAVGPPLLSITAFLDGKTINEWAGSIRIGRELNSDGAAASFRYLLSFVEFHVFLDQIVLSQL